MKNGIFLSLTILAMLPVIIMAQTISITIDTPADGTTYNKGNAFTLTSTASCSGSKCNAVQMSYTGSLSTSSDISQSCGKIDPGESCAKSWTMSADTVGTSQTLNITATSSNAQTTSETIDVNTNAVCGDGDIDGIEICDSSNLAGHTCSSQSFTSGTLDCASNCTAFDTSSCSLETASPPSPEPAILKDLNVIIIEPTEQTFKNGQKIPLKVRIRDSTGSNLITSTITTDSEKLKPTAFRHTGNGIYEAEVTPTNLESGTHKIEVLAKDEGYTTASNTLGIQINSTLLVDLTLEPSHSKGSNMIVTGSTKDHEGKSIQGSANIEGSVNKIKMFSGDTQTTKEGLFRYDYRIGFLDIEGEWEIEATITDKFGNAGIGKAVTSVLFGATGDSYDVKFLSPAENFVYRRGENVKITVEITKGTKKISGGDFSFREPDGNLLKLNEISDGIYSAEHTIDFTAPIGELPFYVIGTKETNNRTNTGAGALSLNIEATDLTIELLSPTGTTFATGETIDIEAKITYPDGSIPDSTHVNLTTPEGTEIVLTKQGNTYAAQYQIPEGQEGSWNLKIQAGDAYENKGTRAVAASIVPFTILSLLAYYWWAFAIGSVPVLYIGGQAMSTQYQTYRIKTLESEKKRVFELKKDAQRKYFKDGTINKATYMDLMEKYETRESNAKKMLEELKSKKKK